jgi:HEAT repeat protein
MSWMQEMAGWFSEKLVHDSGRELDRLARQLRSPHPDERLDAVRKLTWMKADDASALLLAALQDADADVRAAAAAGLGYKARRDAVSPVGVLLGDASPLVRASAVEALDGIGVPRQQSFLRFWRDKIVITDEAGDPRIPELLARALLDEAADVRRSALASLPRHGARGVELARTHLGGRADVDPAEKEAPEKELARALQARAPAHRRAAVHALHQLYGDRAMRPLAEALRDPDADVREAAVEAVTALGPRPALPELLERLGDSDERVVVKVIEGLVVARNLGTFTPDDEDGIHAELRKAALRRAPAAQAVAAWALGEMGRVEAVSTLCELLDEKEEKLVVAACQALAKINDPRAVGPLQKIVEDEARSVDAVSAAVRALGRTADVRVVPVLVRRLFAETRPAVERALEETLGLLCAAVEQPVLADLAAESPEVRLQAIRRAVNEPRLALALVHQVIDTRDERVRKAALEALGIQGHDVAALARSTLRLADKSEARRLLAIDLVALVQPADAPSLLDGLLADPDEPAEVYRHTVATLKRLGSVAALEARKDDPREVVRRYVREALSS